MEMARAMGRTAVLLNKEIDGFIVNRILHAATQEAYRLLDAGVASFEDIDTAVEEGLDWAIGPIRLGGFRRLHLSHNPRLHIYPADRGGRLRPSPELDGQGQAGR